MNIKLHTPKSLTAGSGMSSLKQFFLALVATTISIVLTFGTAAVIDHYKKKAAKKDMVMMIINDFDKTIELVEKVDTGLRKCRDMQQELAIHPERFDSLYVYFASAMSWSMEEFSETIEKIFSTSIETFSTIGDVNFVNDVSTFYTTRHKYKEQIIDELKKEMEENDIILSIKSLMSVDFPEYAYFNWMFMDDMKEQRAKCMRMMNVTEEDMVKFNKKQQPSETDNPEKAAIKQKMMEEYGSYTVALEEARQKFKD